MARWLFSTSTYADWPNSVCVCVCSHTQTHHLFLGFTEGVLYWPYLFGYLFSILKNCDLIKAKLLTCPIIVSNLSWPIRSAGQGAFNLIGSRAQLVWLSRSIVHISNIRVFLFRVYFTPKFLQFHPFFSPLFLYTLKHANRQTS